MKGLCFLVVSHMWVDQKQNGGCFFYKDGYFMILLSAARIHEWTVHHELWHAMENVIRLNTPDAFSNWDSLNPEGFRYSEDYDEFTQLDEDDQYADVRDYFVRVYSITKFTVFTERCTPAKLRICS